MSLYRPNPRRHRARQGTRLSDCERFDPVPRMTSLKAGATKQKSRSVQRDRPHAPQQLYHLRMQARIASAPRVSFAWGTCGPTTRFSSDSQRRHNKNGAVGHVHRHDPFEGMDTARRPTGAAECAHLLFHTRSVHMRVMPTTRSSSDRSRAPRCDSPAAPNPASPPIEPRRGLGEDDARPAAGLSTAPGRRPDPSSAPVRRAPTARQHHWGRARGARHQGARRWGTTCVTPPARPVRVSGPSTWGACATAPPPRGSPCCDLLTCRRHATHRISGPRRSRSSPSVLTASRTVRFLRMAAEIGAYNRVVRSAQGA